MKDDSGSAFPSGEAWVLTDLAGNKTRHSKAALVTGMSLRDYFAGQALPNVKSTITINVDAHNGGCTVDQIGDALAAGLAQAAYQVADAMLAERSK